MHGWRRILRRELIGPLIATLLPTDCFGCGEPLGAVQRYGACPRCWADLEPLRPPLCPCCSLPRPVGTDLTGPAGGRCASCVLDPWRLDGARAAIAYDELSRRFLLRAKLGGRRELFGPLGDQLGRVLLASGFAGGCDVIVPVPAHPWRLLRRGFNPALEIARAVSPLIRIPLIPRALARRLRDHVPSKRMSAPRRLSASLRAFETRVDLSGRRVLLVDDVLTTGATARACAEALRSAGAGGVRVAAWARTLPRAQSSV